MGICTLLFILLTTFTHYIPKENIVLFTPYIFPDTQKYMLHFECLAGQKMVQFTHIPGHPHCLWSVRLIKHKCFVCKLCRSVGVCWLSVKKTRKLFNLVFLILGFFLLFVLLLLIHKYILAYFTPKLVRLLLK